VEPSRGCLSVHLDTWLDTVAKDLLFLRSSGP
jgi:hypothetical protein